MIEEILNVPSVFNEILVVTLVGVGTGIVAYFRKIQKTNSDLCKKVERLQKTIVVLAKVIDQNVKRAHPDQESELDELVTELLYNGDRHD